MRQVLDRWIGREAEQDQLTAALRQAARSFGAAVVGALLVTCSDETEAESARRFDRLFVQPTLPALKDQNRAAFRSANLGARYEWGAVRVAEEHYAIEATQEAFKVMVVKLNAHVGVTESSRGRLYGKIDRYGLSSSCCGALSAMLAGAELPAIEELRALFGDGARDRLAALASPEVVPPEHKALHAALVNARLQSDRAVRDILAHSPASPTLYLVLPSVTINLPGPDHDFLVGYHLVDRRTDSPGHEYKGLGSDPAGYRVDEKEGRLIITDAEWRGEETK